MTDINYSYRDSPTIKKFSESRAFIRALMGPFGSGKSSGAVIELVKLAYKQKVQADGKRHAKFAAVRNTYPQLNDTTLRTVLDWLPDGPSGFGTYYKSEHRLVVDRLDPSVEFEILFRALDRPEQVSNLLSLELTASWINEAREIPRAVFTAIQGRVDRYPAIKDGGCVGAGVILDTNPPDTDSWFYEFFEEKKPSNAELFRQPGGRGPLAENLSNLSPSYYKNLLQSMDEDEINVYVDGEYGFLRDGRPVFPGYNDRVHCRDIEYHPGLPVYRGWDFGLTPAVSFSQVLPSGVWNTFDELVADEVYIDEFSDQVLLHCAERQYGDQYRDIGDPAGKQRNAATKKTSDEKTCFDILWSKGIRIEPGAQDLTTRLESVRKALRTMVAGEPQVAVHSRCKVLRKGYQGQYKYKRIKVSGTAERYHDFPDKNDHSHIHDANQYVAGNLFGSALVSRPIHEKLKSAPIRERV